MPLVRAQMIFPYFSNLPTDVAVNQFHFISDVDPVQATANLIAARLATFYNGIYGPSAGAKANYIDWPLARVKCFDLSDPPPRVPLIGNPNFAAGTGIARIPTEVSAVMSFHAAPESGVRFQRLYNRIYLPGILDAEMAPSAVDGFPTFTSAFTTRVNTQAAALLAANTAGLEWVQVSRATGLTEARPIVGGWIDNSPDTQRRRSVIATLRNIWP